MRRCGCGLPRHACGYPIRNNDGWQIYDAIATLAHVAPELLRTVARGLAIDWPALGWRECAACAAVERLWPDVRHLPRRAHCEREAIVTEERALRDWANGTQLSLFFEVR